MIRIGAMVSGGGTNLQAVLDAIDAGKIDGQVVTVVSSKEGAYAMERAAKHNIPSVVISKKDYPNGGFEKALIDHFKSMNVDLIILAGYMTILGEEFIKAFENKIMNITQHLFLAFVAMAFMDLEFIRLPLKKVLRLQVLLFTLFHLLLMQVLLYFRRLLKF